MEDTYEIQNATEQHLMSIKEFLKQESKINGEGFLCNWSVIKTACKNNELAVLLINDNTLGFITYNIDILEIHPDFRGQGYGRLLAQWAIDNAYINGISVIKIECKPETSIPFWKKMGFTVYKSMHTHLDSVGYKILERKLPLSKGKKIPFIISFYPEDAKYYEHVKPFKVYEGMGGVAKDSEIILPERAICYTPEINSLGDCIVSINIDGKEIYKDKVKYDDAKNFGVQRDLGYMYYLDRIKQNIN